MAIPTSASVARWFWMTSQDSVAFLCRKRNGATFIAIVLAWLLFDQATKAFFESFDLGVQIAGPFFGIVDFTLVHNTGAAWGIFSDMTALLAVLSVLVCALAALYLFVFAPTSSPLAAVGLSLVFAGGIGNAIDRLCNYYVIDFIRPVFIDFPVFNIADIGVTCGCVLFLVSLALEWARQSREDVHE